MSPRGARGPLGSKPSVRTGPARPGGVRRLAPDDVVLDRADAVVIGGGVTGVGVLWDLTLRGLDVVLVEQASIGRGTSGAFHGLLHSGARYAVTDPTTAAECLRENRLLRTVAGRFIEDTGGLFVRGPEDDPAWEAAWLDACRRAGLSPRRLTPEETLRREPGLRRDLVSAFAVPDATIDGFRLLWSMVWAAVEAGARVYLGARVVDYLTDEAGVRGVRVVGAGPAPGPRNGRAHP
ncbi:MAG: FAD-dependent oxidoreductase, partial [Firmicutes bacterium]|nr:FAD-dependent oxidoreductase [Bacillota bacterium]